MNEKAYESEKSVYRGGLSVARILLLSLLTFSRKWEWTWHPSPRAFADTPNSFGGVDVNVTPTFHPKCLLSLPRMEERKSGRTHYPMRGGVESRLLISVLDVRSLVEEENGNEPIRYKTVSYVSCLSYRQQILIKLATLRTSDIRYQLKKRGIPSYRLPQTSSLFTILCYYIYL